MDAFTNLTLEKYLEELSSEKPIPGGGSVSAYVGSLAMGLTQMVGRVTLKRKKKKDLTPDQEKKEDERRGTIQKIVESLEKTKKDAFEIVNLDPKVYQEVMEAWGKEDKMDDALNNSFRLQANLTLLITMAHEWNKHMADLVTGSIKNDLLVSAALLEAAFRGAYHTALINVCYMKDAQNKKRSEEALEELKRRFERGEKGGD